MTLLSVFISLAFLVCFNIKIASNGFWDLDVPSINMKSVELCERVKAFKGKRCSNFKADSLQIME